MPAGHSPKLALLLASLEMLAVVTFMRHFCHYLLGRHFVLRTDHVSLKGG